MSTSYATQMNAQNTLRTLEHSSVSSATLTLSTKTLNTTGSLMSIQMVSIHTYFENSLMCNMSSVQISKNIVITILIVITMC